MNYSTLNNCSFFDLKKMAKEMDLKSRRSKIEYINDITKAFKDYEFYLKEKIEKYTRIRQLGNKGKEGITYLVKDRKNREFAMKTFRKTKSSNTLKNEYILQKRAASQGVSPRVVEYDSVSKYIVMEKMDIHLVDIMNKQKGNLGKNHQLQIIDIFRKLDQVGVFHGDSNILNYMLKDNKIYIIDFGFAKEINHKLIKKLGTQSPNVRIMTTGLIIKLKEMNCPPSSWKYLKQELTDEEIKRFEID